MFVKYLYNHWYKQTLIISNVEQLYLNKINSLKIISSSGYLNTNLKIGCIFSIKAWPFIIINLI